MVENVQNCVGRGFPMEILLDRVTWKVQMEEVGRNVPFLFGASNLPRDDTDTQS